MSYYILKHSAKGTTWGEHKYIRKEGNRYIYPDDVKNSANDNIEKQKELNEENTKNDTQYEKALNDYLKTISKDLNVYNLTEYEHERLYKNDPKYKELSDLYDEEFHRTHEAKWRAEKEKRDYINQASENKQNRILSEARKAADEHREKEAIENKKKEEYPEEEYPKDSIGGRIEFRKAAEERYKDYPLDELYKIRKNVAKLSKKIDYEDKRPWSGSNRMQAHRNMYDLEYVLDDLIEKKTKSKDKQNRILSKAKKAADNHRQEEKDKEAKEEHDSRAAQAAAEKETYLKRAENKKKVENKRDRLEYIRNARKTRNRDKKYVVDTEDGGAFVTRNREKAVQVRNEVKQNKLKREDPIKYYLQRRKSKRK